VRTYPSRKSQAAPIREDLRTAGRTPIHFIWKASHLRVTTLAGVTAHGVREFEYLPQRLQERSGEEAATGSTTETAVPERLQFVDLTEGAAYDVCLGNY
jgi:hypothetical protein